MLLPAGWKDGLIRVSADISLHRVSISLHADLDLESEGPWRYPHLVQKRVGNQSSAWLQWQEGGGTGLSGELHSVASSQPCLRPSMFQRCLLLIEPGLGSLPAIELRQACEGG